VLHCNIFCINLFLQQ